MRNSSGNWENISKSLKRKLKILTDKRLIKVLSHFECMNHTLKFDIKRCLKSVSNLILLIRKVHWNLTISLPYFNPLLITNTIPASISYYITYRLLPISHRALLNRSQNVQSIRGSEGVRLDYEKNILLPLSPSTIHHFFGIEN